MKRILGILALALLTACAKTAPVGATHTGFDIDQFVAVTLEYQGAHTLIGADTYGPTTKEVLCQRSMGAAAARDTLPPGHQLVSTCLHVKFAGPLPHGAAVIVPSAGTPFEYLAVGVEYSDAGEFVAAQALHSAQDAKTCLRESREVITDNYKDGHIAAGNSLLLYCIPVPVIKTNPKEEGGVV